MYTTVYTERCNYYPRGGGEGRGVLPETLDGGMRPTFQNPYPIYDQNLRILLPYL